MSKKNNFQREPKPRDERIATSIVTLRNKKKKGVKAVIVTAYTYPEALIADKSGVDVILIGDSLGMTTQGYKSTIAVTMDDMISHCRGVWRANQKSFQIGDMPFMSYQESNKLAIRNAGRFIKEGGCDAIKIEGAMLDRVKAIVDSGILVMSHLGLTPQSRAALGGYRVQGKSLDATEKILKDALDLQEAGCSFLLLEAMPRESAAVIASELSIPVYGVGAGDKVDGQLVILHDLIGMFFDFKSKFIKRYCNAGEMILEALKDYAYEVRTNQFPSSENFYEMKESDLEIMLQDPRWKYILENDKKS